jgi:3-oxoacid CoA-transferase subunit A
LDKVVESAEAAIAEIKDGALIGIPGFFAAGVPRVLLQALISQGTKDLTLCCGCGPMLGASDELRALVSNGQVRKVIDSYGLFRSASKGMEDPFEQAVRSGEIELEVYPMGTLAEKYRAAGAGIPAFYTPTGVGSLVEDRVISNLEENCVEKEVRVINGKKSILEYALQPDYCFVHAHTGDREGNLRYRMTARNFNQVLAMAGAVTIAEVENLVSAGELDGDLVQTPGIYVKKIVAVERADYTISID